MHSKSSHGENQSRLRGGYERLSEETVVLSERRLRWNMKLHFRRRNIPLHRQLSLMDTCSFAEIKTEFITDFPITLIHFSSHECATYFRYHPRYVISIQFPCISWAVEFYNSEKMKFFKALLRFITFRDWQIIISVRQIIFNINRTCEIRLMS